jgi:hypothetical protein
LKSGVILVFVLAMKNPASSDTMEETYETYNILCKGRKIYSDLTEEEYFDIMEGLAIQFYQTGSPSPDELETEIIGVTRYGKTQSRRIK